MAVRWLDRAKRCPHCGRWVPYPLQRCRRRRCPGYAPLWAGDWQRVITLALAQLEGVALITVTAPGEAEGLAWDTSRCQHDPDVPCSGKLGCRVVDKAARVWHSSAEERWAALHRAAAERARRRAGRGMLVCAKVWERQKRGVDHLHIVAPYRTVAERRRVDAYVAALKELAPRYWFGFVDLQRGRRGRGGGAAAAAYLGKYVSKAMLEQFAPAARRPCYVSPRLTQLSGCTMRRLRLRRYLYVVWGGEPLSPGEPMQLLDVYAALTRELGARPILARAP